MAKATAAPAAKSLIKREPVAIGTALLTLIGTALYVLPSVGIRIPDKASKLIQIGFTLAGGLGLRSLVKPA